MTRNRWIDDLQWIRPGQQTRSQRTQHAILDAAEALFARQGVDGTSVAAIAEEAKCSVGAVYHHFKDKEALLYALYKRMTDRFQSVSADALDPARWEGASIEDILRGYLEFSLRISRENPGFKQAALEAAQRNPALQQHYAEIQRDLYQGLRKLILARSDGIRHTDPDLAVRFVLDQFAAMIQLRKDKSAVYAQMHRRSDAHFIDQAIQSAKSYLKID